MAAVAGETQKHVRTLGVKRLRDVSEVLPARRLSCWSTCKGTPRSSLAQAVAAGGVVSVLTVGMMYRHLPWLTTYSSTRDWPRSTTLSSPTAADWRCTPPSLTS